jgi:tetratricopeptide (TPR) repeat protein
MYLKTNRRVRRRRGIALWRVALWLLAPVLIFIGIGIYQNRESYIPFVNNFIGRAVVQVEGVVETIQAPTPTPTQDPQNGRQRAVAAWSQGAFSDAVALYENVIGALPNDMEAHYFLTLGLINEGREQEAVQAAENTVTANPFSSDAWAIRAMALNRAGRYGESVASALRALELKPDSARAHAFLAESFFDLGQVQRAQSEVEQAIELDPDGFEGYFVRARINLESLYDFDAAKADLNTAYDYSGRMPYIGVILAREYIYREPEKSDLVQEGMNILQGMDERNPQNPLVLLELANYYRTVVGDPSQAATYLTRCVTNIPQNIDCHFLLGRVQYDQEEPEIAAESFLTAVELGSNNPRHYFWVGRSQLAMSNCAAAAEYTKIGYEIAVETNQYLTDLEFMVGEVQLKCTGYDLPTLPPTETPDVTPTPTPEA